MRYTCRSSNTSSTARFSALADSRSEPNGFSITTRTSEPSLLCSPAAPSAETITGKKPGAVER